MTPVTSPPHIETHCRSPRCGVVADRPVVRVLCAERGPKPKAIAVMDCQSCGGTFAHEVLESDCREPGVAGGKRTVNTPDENRPSLAEQGALTSSPSNGVTSY